MLRIERVVQWMNVIRQHKNEEQRRILESFWESQLTSKQWIIDSINQKQMPVYGNVYIFGGWFGVLGGMLLDNYKHISKVYSIDIDANTKIIGEQLNPDVQFVTCDMAQFNFEERPSLVINTSTEHITQDSYTNWLQNIPNFVPIILQGNDFFSCNEHVRCSKSLSEFKEMNPLDSIRYEGEFVCPGPTGPFTRFMTIGYKYAS